MEELNSVDVAIGWGLVIAIVLTCYYGIPFLIVRMLQILRASFEQDRLAREAIQEEEDEAFRQELLWIVENEQREKR